MITNKDIRVENGNLIINGDKYPLDGQSPEAIMEIVEDNSDTTPTENSDAPVTSGGVFTAIKAVSDAITGQIGDNKYAVVDQTFENVTINTAWGTLYESDTLTIDITSLQLTQAPKAVFVGLKSSNAGVLLELGSPSANGVPLHLVRPTALTVGATISLTALVIY